MGQDLNIGSGQVQISHSQPVTGSGLLACTHKSELSGQDLDRELEPMNELEDTRARL